MRLFFMNIICIKYSNYLSEWVEMTHTDIKLNSPTRHLGFLYRPHHWQ